MNAIKNSCTNCGSKLLQGEQHCRRCGYDEGVNLWRCRDCWAESDAPLVRTAALVKIPAEVCKNCGYDFATGRSPYRRGFNHLIRPAYWYFGGKCNKTVWDIVWNHLGRGNMYMEPFLGSAAMLINRPHGIRYAYAADNNGYISNFWRAVQAAPDEVMKWCDWPINETDLHARHDWLRQQHLVKRLQDNEKWYDAKAAGFWVWGQCQWLATGWCEGNRDGEEDESSTKRQMPRLGGAWRQRSDLGACRGHPHFDRRPPSRVRPDACPKGVVAAAAYRLPPTRTGLGGMASDFTTLEEKCHVMRLLHDRLKDVRVFCRAWDSMALKPEWERLLCEAAFTRGARSSGSVGIFLDPPYEANRAEGCYGRGDTAKSAQTLSRAVEEWCLQNGRDERLRICLCGLEGEHNALELAGWTKKEWKGRRGFAGAENLNRKKERIWLSPV